MRFEMFGWRILGTPDEQGRYEDVPGNTRTEAEQVR